MSPDVIEHTFQKISQVVNINHIKRRKSKFFIRPLQMSPPPGKPQRDHFSLTLSSLFIFSQVKPKDNPHKKILKSYEKIGTNYYGF